MAVAAGRVQAMRQRSGWRLQPARAEDHRALLLEWIAADPEHAGRVDDAWWFQEGAIIEERKKRGEKIPIVDNLLVVDREGPLFFLRCSIAMRLDIQFHAGLQLQPGPFHAGLQVQPGPVSRQTEMRTARALRSGLPWLAGQTKQKGYAQMIYESRSPRLVNFLERIGFREVSTEHVLTL